MKNCSYRISCNGGCWYVRGFSLMQKKVEQDPVVAPIDMPMNDEIPTG